jgi:trehalose 6-phosphate phosphatase
MTAIHWRQATDTLARTIATPRFGVFSDLDGTLAPIAPTPDAADISPRARQLLADLRDTLPVVGLVSGRRVASLQSKVGLLGLIYVGNHGLERWIDEATVVMPEASKYIERLQEAKRQLQPLEQAGVHVEDKGATLSFHYRQAADPAAFASAASERIASIVSAHGLVLLPGKMVFEVRPPVDMDKGIAFGQLVREHKLDAALFLGDDISDLHALNTARQLRSEGVCDAWGIGVQSVDAPAGLAEAADFLADGVPDVEELLAWVLSARKASST